MKPSELPHLDPRDNRLEHFALSESRYIELDIRAKKRILFFWECKKRVAESHMEKNKKKIADLEQKLQNQKILEESQK